MDDDERLLQLFARHAILALRTRGDMSFLEKDQGLVVQINKPISDLNAFLNSVYNGIDQAAQLCGVSGLQRLDDDIYTAWKNLLSDSSFEGSERLKAVTDSGLQRLSDLHDINFAPA